MDKWVFLWTILILENCQSYDQMFNVGHMFNSVTYPILRRMVGDICDQQLQY